MFFGRTFLLTPEPVSISESWLELTPQKPISAVTGGAALHVDVTQEIGYVSITGDLERIIPPGTVTAELIPESGAPIRITNGPSGHGKEDVFLILVPENGEVPTDTKFRKIRIRSVRPLKRAKISWRNYTL